MIIDIFEYCYYHHEDNYKANRFLEATMNSYRENIFYKKIYEEWFGK